MRRTSPIRFIAAGSVLAAVFYILISPVHFRNSADAAESQAAFFDLPVDEFDFVIGEELHYNVSYSIFDIGLIKLMVTDTGMSGGVRVFKMKAFADSYSGLPFVDLHQVFYSEMNEEAFSQFFITHNTEKAEQKPFTRYRFDYKNKKARFDIGVEPGTVIKRSGEEPISDHQLDGLSLFYYARKNCRQRKKISVPVFVNEKSYRTHFNFMNKVGSTEIDAVPYPVETVEFDGTSDFTGVFGLTGYFKGYFSNDEAGIPIVAKMKVILGSVHIELIHWDHAGWIPPKGVE